MNIINKIFKNKNPKQLILKLKKSNKRLKQEIKILQEELIRKNEIINDTKKQSDILLKTTIRQSTNITNLKEKINEKKQ